jgi:chromosomal replication initiation ATPase DnaA
MTQESKTALIMILNDWEIETGADLRNLIQDVEAIKVEPVYPREDADMKIFDAVEQVTGINAIRLISKNRIRKYSDTRAMVVYFLRDYGFTFVEIGMILNRHYTSAIHLSTVHNALVNRDKEYRETFNSIAALINKKNTIFAK